MTQEELTLQKTGKKRKKVPGKRPTKKTKLNQKSSDKSGYDLFDALFKNASKMDAKANSSYKDKDFQSAIDDYQKALNLLLADRTGEIISHPDDRKQKISDLNFNIASCLLKKEEGSHHEQTLIEIKSYLEISKKYFHSLASHHKKCDFIKEYFSHSLAVGIQFAEIYFKQHKFDHSLNVYLELYEEFNLSAHIDSEAFDTIRELLTLQLNMILDLLENRKIKNTSLIDLMDFISTDLNESNLLKKIWGEDVLRNFILALQQTAPNIPINIWNPAFFPHVSALNQAPLLEYQTEAVDEEEFLNLTTLNNSTLH